MKRNQWPMAPATNATPGSDGKVRKLGFKVTKGGSVKIFLRPITEVLVVRVRVNPNPNPKPLPE